MIVVPDVVVKRLTGQALTLWLQLYEVIITLL